VGGPTPGPLPVPGWSDWVRVELPAPDPAAGIRFGAARQAWSGVADTDGAPFRAVLAYCEDGARLAWDAGGLPGQGSQANGKFGIGGWCDVFGGQQEIHLPCRGVLTARSTDQVAGGQPAVLFVATAPAWDARQGAEGVAMERAAIAAGANVDFDIAPQGILNGRVWFDPVPGAAGSALRVSRDGAVFASHGPANGFFDLPPLDGGWVVNYSQGAGLGAVNVAVLQRVPVP